MTTEELAEVSHLAHSLAVDPVHGHYGTQVLKVLAEIERLQADRDHARFEANALHNAMVIFAVDHGFYVRSNEVLSASDGWYVGSDVQS